MRWVKVVEVEEAAVAAAVVAAVVAEAVVAGRAGWAVQKLLGQAVTAFAPVAGNAYRT